jgi:HK97 family phage major capsid protein
MHDVHVQRRQEIGNQIKALMAIRGPRTAHQKLLVNNLLKEADELEAGIADETERRRLDAFTAFLRSGHEDRNLLTHSSAHLEIRDLGESGMGTGAATGAGALVPVSFSGMVDEAQKLVGPLVDPTIVTFDDTPDGRNLDRPSDNDTSIAATLLGENQQTTLEDIPVIGQNILGAWKMTSGLVKVSNELLRDAGFDFSAYLARKFGVRMGRGLNPLVTTGTAINEPKGLVTAILAQGNIVQSGFGNQLVPDDFTDLEASVDPIYRNAPGAAFMISSATLQALRKQTDSVGNPVFKQLHSGNTEKDFIFGYPLLINNALDSIQTIASSPTVTKTVALFGDFKQFRVRRVRPVIYRLSERFAEFGITAFLMLGRYDSALCDGGGGAVKGLQVNY